MVLAITETSLRAVAGTHYARSAKCRRKPPCPLSSTYPPYWPVASSTYECDEELTVPAGRVGSLT
jgi:hypothetical protein